MKKRKMAASILLAAVALLTLVEAIEGVCEYKLTATPMKSYKAHHSYSADKECTYTIAPGSYYTRNNEKKYYLEVTWDKFDVNGEMPRCSIDSVEVFLTRSHRSIGKFCSNNAAKPFQMYSHDGYGKIRLRVSSSYSKSNFGFYYQLKKYSQYNFGIQRSYSMSTFCPASFSSSGSGLIYSSGWPNGYSSSTSDCHHSVYVQSKYTATKVVFMDLDLDRAESYCYDSVELKGSDKSSGYKYHISWELCRNAVRSNKYTPTWRYLEIIFSRHYGSGKNNRGFVAGYISYGKRLKSDDKTGLIAGTIAEKLALKIAAPAVVFIIVLAVYLVYRRWRKGRRRRMHEAMLERCARVNAAKNQEETVPLAQGTTSDSTTNPPANTAAYPTAYPTASPAYTGSENALQPQPYPMSQQPFPNANQGQCPPEGSNLESQGKGLPAYPQAGTAAPLSSGNYPAAAAYPPQQSLAVNANASYPPSNVAPFGGPEAYPTQPPPAYSSVVNQ